MNLFIQRHRRRSGPGAMPGTITVQPHAQAPCYHMISFGPQATKGSIENIAFDAIGNLPSMPEQHEFMRSEEHTSELQSRGHLVCRLLLEKKILRDCLILVAIQMCLIKRRMGCYEQ